MSDTGKNLPEDPAMDHRQETPTQRQADEAANKPSAASAKAAAASASAAAASAKTTAASASAAAASAKTTAASAKASVKTTAASARAAVVNPGADQPADTINPAVKGTDHIEAQTDIRHKDSIHTETKPEEATQEEASHRDSRRTKTQQEGTVHKELGQAETGKTETGDKESDRAKAGSSQADHAQADRSQPAHKRKGSTGASQTKGADRQDFWTVDTASKAGGKDAGSENTASKAGGKDAGSENTASKAAGKDIESGPAAASKAPGKAAKFKASAARVREQVRRVMPLLRTHTTTAECMFFVILALLPAAGTGIYHYGVRAMFLIGLGVAAAIVTELICDLIFRKGVTIFDYSAVVTGLIVGLLMPPSAPYRFPVIASAIAIFAAKMLFGGIGKNILNPAATGKLVLLLFFPTVMADFSTGTYSRNIPLQEIQNGSTVRLIDMLTGNVSGCIGTTSVIAILIGVIFLVFTGIIDLQVSLPALISFTAFYFFFGQHGLSLYFICAQLCGGSLLFTFFFMANDYTTSPVGKRARIVDGVLLGIVTGLLRVFAGQEENACLYALLITNVVSRIFERRLIPRPFGSSKYHRTLRVHVPVPGEQDKAQGTARQLAAQRSEANFREFEQSVLPQNAAAGSETAGTITQESINYFENRQRLDYGPAPYGYGYPQTGGYGYTQNGGYAQGMGYPQNGGYAQGTGYPQDAGYAQGTGYPENSGYVQGAGYPQNGGYAQGAGYSQNGGYVQGNGYPQNGGYAPGTNYPQNGGYAPGTNYPQNAGYAPRADYPQNGSNVSDTSYPQAPFVPNPAGGYDPYAQGNVYDPSGQYASDINVPYGGYSQGYGAYTPDYDLSRQESSYYPEWMRQPQADTAFPQGTAFGQMGQQDGTAAQPEVTSGQPGSQTGTAVQAPPATGQQDGMPADAAAGQVSDKDSN